MHLLHVFVSSLSSSLPRCLTLGISDRPWDDDNEAGISDGGCSFAVAGVVCCRQRIQKKATPEGAAIALAICIGAYLASSAASASASAAVSATGIFSATTV